MSKIVIGRDNRGRVTHIAHVASGLACGCVCLDCGQRLIAKKGEVREHHFAHASGEEHAWDWESHLHKYAKQLICDEGALAVPLNEEMCEVLGLVSGSDRVRLAAGDIPFRTEVRLGKVQPDLLLQLSDRQVSIAFEVLVTHACDAAKVAEFKRQQIPVLEIDLRKFHHTNFKPSVLRSVVIDQVSGKAWLWPVPPARVPKEPATQPAHFNGPEPARERKRRPEAPPRIGEPPALPAPAVLDFHVPAWNTLVKVEIRPHGAGVFVTVRGPQGGFREGQPELGTYRVVDAIEEMFDQHAPWAKRKEPHVWYVEDWDAAMIAYQLRVTEQTFPRRQRELRRRQEETLSQELGEARDRAIKFNSAAKQPARPVTVDPRENPYARRKG